MSTEQTISRKAAEQMAQAARGLRDVDALLAELGERLTFAAREVATDAGLAPRSPGAGWTSDLERS